MNIEKSNNKNNRLTQYLDTHISPINFITEYQEKKLPISILIYKVCLSFPMDKLGSHKTSHKFIISDQFHYLKPFLGTEYEILIKNKNKYRPKIGQYCEFLFLSFLITCLTKTDLLELPSVNDDISEGWDFKYNGIRYDITTNLNKISKPNIQLIKLDLIKILDDKNLYLSDFCLEFYKIVQDLKIELDSEKVAYSNLIVNKIRNKYVELVNHKSANRKKFTEQLIVEKKSSQTLDILIPNIGLDNVNEIEQTEIELVKVSEEERLFFKSFNKLKPEDKQIIMTMITELSKKLLS